MNIENPMVLHQSQHDVQMQKREMRRCDCCEESVSADEMRKYGDLWVCDLCESRYLKESTEESHIEDFVEEQKQDYLEWWFSSLDKQERRNILQEAYECMEYTDARTLWESRRSYCEEREDEFIDYLRGALR